jgi:hypothetical protein
MASASLCVCPANQGSQGKTELTLLKAVSWTVLQEIFAYINEPILHWLEQGSPG